MPSTAPGSSGPRSLTRPAPEGTGCADPVGPTGCADPVGPTGCADPVGPTTAEFRDRLLARRQTLVERQIDCIVAALDGTADLLTGRCEPPVTGGLRDQLLSNLADERRVLALIRAERGARSPDAAP